jgi:signal transduction histidine kinase
VANAIKFTAPHGHITLKVETFDQEVKVHVIDDGHGIAAKDRERVFDRFTQIHDSVTNKNEGNGLGLFLSRYLVQLHGGTIDLESEVGRGSKFTVTLPKITTYPVKDLQASRRRMEDLHNVHLEFSDIDFG